MMEKSIQIPGPGSAMALVLLVFQFILPQLYQMPLKLGFY